MIEFKDLFQTADWKYEKHIPVIEVPDIVKKGEFFKTMVSVGKKVPHPNKTEHHIRWIEIYFLSKGEIFPYQIGKFEFTAHGESPKGPDTSSIYTHHDVISSFKTDKPGIILAASYCNIHGLWQNSKEITIQ
jgi:superoxide reductase